MIIKKPILNRMGFSILITTLAVQTKPVMIIPFLIIVQLYLITRFAVKGSFRFSDSYNFKYLLITAVIPIAGYFIAMYLITRAEDQLIEED
jgi:hypothetical protein